MIKLGLLLRILDLDLHPVPACFYQVVLELRNFMVKVDDAGVVLVLLFDYLLNQSLFIETWHFIRKLLGDGIFRTK